MLSESDLLLNYTESLRVICGQLPHSEPGRRNLHRFHQGPVRQAVLAEHHGIARRVALNEVRQATWTDSHVSGCEHHAFVESSEVHRVRSHRVIERDIASGAIRT